jgi:uncharacterized protein (UPF0332 family)
VSFHDELLEHAKHLANREPRHPRQVSLRRAVSAAYYALFHALLAEAADMLAYAHPGNLRAQIGRAFSHGHMKEVCKSFSSGSPIAATNAIIIPPIRTEIGEIARAFISLQQARHEADYDTLTSLSKTYAIQKIDDAEQALGMLVLIRGEPNSQVFLAALLLQKQWSRPL